MMEQSGGGRPDRSTDLFQPMERRKSQLADCKVWLKDFDNGCKWVCFWVWVQFGNAPLPNATKLKSGESARS
jgi:hypothetical protein